MEKKLIPLALCLLFVACGSHKTDGNASEGDTIPMRYAHNLTMVRYADRTEVTIRNPWDTTSVLHRYVLVDARNYSLYRDTRKSNPSTIIPVPLQRAGVFTSVHCGLLQELGVQSAIRGICELEYINIPYVRQGVAAGRIANFGSAMEPTLEVIMDAEPDALMISPFENSGGYGRVERLGIPIIECADYMEYSPLARAEWMKFYGLLFGVPERADSLFQSVEQRYLALKAQAAHVAHRPTLIAEKPYSGVWYVPGGGSVMGILYRDAGADYLYADRPETGSLALSVETVFERGQRADIWLIKYNQSSPLTLRQLTSDYPPFAHFRSVGSGGVYGCNQATSRFYEETPYHPDRLLADLVRIIHPELGIQSEKSYFCKVE
ncbi:MAG: ABC transporter substrate-binding protein [Bacteroidaceae bacterium]|nr:ABC transporter substrate-binding protein [Bacteroidaceae bacterium]